MRREVIGNCELFNCDCLDLMKQYPDKYFSLAIVDPPFGMIDHATRNKQKDGKKAYCYDNKISKWDNPPDQTYFNELFRLSSYCIIFGGNYFDLPPSRNFIIYRKSNIPEGFNMAMCEYAWTNIDGNAKIFDYFSLPDPNRFHPCQKPIQLYKWILTNYAKPGMKILDTHFGSGSLAIACNELGFSLVASEIDQDYFEAAVERLRLHASQQVFNFEGTK
jgi:site-specific DNA-methyltransferase (adenine-specific)